MGHHISAIVIADVFDLAIAEKLDLVPVPMQGLVTMFHIDHCYTAYWQKVRGCKRQLPVTVPDSFDGDFPTEGVLIELVKEITGRAEPRFAIIATEYFGGVGSQFACTFIGDRFEASGSINEMLRLLGVVRDPAMDEFDTVGLGDHRSTPEHIERYSDLCDELGA